MRTPRRHGAAALAVLAVLGVATACENDTPGDRLHAVPGSARPTAVDPADVSPAGLTKAPHLDHPSGALADATFGACAIGPGKVTVTGAVSNGGREAADYVVTVSWVNERSDVVGRGVATVADVAPGARKDWRLRTKVGRGATACTQHVERGRLAPH